MVIRSAILLLKNQLKEYLRSKSEWVADYDVVLDHPSKIEKLGDANLNNRILICLSRIEEEKTMKNNASHRKIKLNGNIEYANPEFFLNMYVLISANFESYENSLTWISCALEFFQSKIVFTPHNSPDSQVFDNMSVNQKKRFKLVTELHSISNQQTNNIWENFGGKQLPHFMLKVWLVAIKAEQTLSEGPPITHIESSEVIN